MKLTVLGGGGVRTPFLAKSLALAAKETGLSEVVFMDNNPQKLFKYGKIAKHIAKLCCPALSVVLTTNAQQALENADYVITTIRAEGDDGRVFDESTALSYGLLGQETTGAGGFAMALRSIPTLLEYCAMAEKLAKPGAPIFNFTNPSGIVTQAMRSKGFSHVYGVCDAPSGFFRQLHNMLGKPNSIFDARCFGLNHLSWFDNFTLDGKDVSATVLNHKNLFKDTEMRLFDPQFIRQNDNLLPNEYLYFYYYPEKSMSGMLKGETRGKLIQQVNNKMDAALDLIDIDKDFGKAFECFMRHYLIRENSYFSIESGQKRPEQMALPTVTEFIKQPDGASYAGVALAFIRAQASGKSTRMVLSVPNNDSISGLAPEDVVELSCTIGANGVVPDKIGEIPPMQMNLVRQVKLYENLSVQAIIEKDFAKAVKALMAHPLVRSYPTAQALVEIYTQHYKKYIGEWKNSSAEKEA